LKLCTLLGFGTYLFYLVVSGLVSGLCVCLVRHNFKDFKIPRFKAKDSHAKIHDAKIHDAKIQSQRFQDAKIQSQRYKDTQCQRYKGYKGYI
jgi:hypothetical protein